MKEYIKPALNLINISVNKDIATVNLTDWLSGNELADYGQTITTYEYQS